MKKAALCILAATLMSGCGSTHVKRYFEIRSIVAAEPALPKIERRLLVETASVDPLYDDIRILYRVSPFELRYYPYEFWAEKPGKQIRAAMAEYFAEKKVFPWIAQETTREAVDIVLRSRVRVLEEIDSPNTWQASLAMDLEFVDAKTDKPIITWTFDRKGQMAKSMVGDLPAALSRILEEELEKVTWELARALEKK